MPSPQELLQMAQAAGVKFPALPPRLQEAIASGRMDEATARQRALANAPQYRAAMGLPPTGGPAGPAPDIPSIDGGGQGSGQPRQPRGGFGRVNGGGLQPGDNPRIGGRPTVEPRGVFGPGPGAGVPPGVHDWNPAGGNYGRATGGPLTDPGRGATLAGEYARLTGGGLQGRPGGLGASLQGTTSGLPPSEDPAAPGTMTAGGFPAPGAGSAAVAATGFVPRQRPRALPADGSGTGTPGIGGSVGGDTKMPDAGPPAVQPKPQLADLADVGVMRQPPTALPTRRRPPMQRMANKDGGLSY